MLQAEIWSDNCRTK